MNGEATLDEKSIVDPLKITSGLGIVRRRRWYLWVVILAYLPVMQLTLVKTQSFRITGTVFVVWLVVLCIVVALSAVARCPRCGNYFHMNGLTLLYFRKCLHCGLHIKADKTR